MLNKESFLKASIYCKLYFEIISTLFVKILSLWELLNLKRAEANDYQQFKIQIQTMLYPQGLVFKWDLSLCEKRTYRALAGQASHLPNHCLYWRNVRVSVISAWECGLEQRPCDLTSSPPGDWGPCTLKCIYRGQTLSAEQNPSWAEALWRAVSVWRVLQASVSGLSRTLRL